MDDHTRMSLFLSSLCASWTCEEEEVEEEEDVIGWCKIQLTLALVE